MSKTLIFYLLFLFTIGFALEEESYSELEKETKDLQNKIKTTKKDISAVKKKIDSDKKSYSKYKKHRDNYFDQQQAELDSLKSDYRKLHIKTDSLANVIKVVKAGQKELDLQQKHFHITLINACKQIRETISFFPPGNVKNQTGALDFLQSELATGAVDNSEALERLWQVLSVLSEGTQSIESYSAKSPVSFINGQVNFIKIGYSYLAIVNEQGTNGAIWTSATETEKSLWKEIEDSQKLLALNKCIRIRMGNSVPEIIGIPFHHDIVSDMPDQNGENK